MEEKLAQERRKHDQVVSQAKDEMNKFYEERKNRTEKAKSENRFFFSKEIFFIGIEIKTLYFKIELKSVMLVLKHQRMTKKLGAISLN